MRRTLLAVIAVSLLVGVALADSVPDPIISPRGGTGSTSFTGTIVLTVTGTSDCTQQDGFSQCNTYLVGVAPDGNTVLTNNTGGDITNLLYEFSFPQTLPFNTDDQSIFRNAEPYPTANSTSAALLTGGIIFPAPLPCVGEVNYCNFAPMEVNGVTEWSNQFKGLLIPGSGDPTQSTLTITLTSNVPEPGSLALLMAGFGALWFARKRWMN